MVGTGLIIRFLFRYLWIKFVGKEQLKQFFPSPVMYYRDELAAAVESIDRSANENEINDKISDLLVSIADNIASTLGLRKKDYRMYFVNPDSNNSNQTKISAFRVGREFEMEKKGKAQLGPTVEKDAKAIDLLLDESATEIVVPGMTGMRKTSKRNYLLLGISVEHSGIRVG
ncbi:hypothetical protein [Alicyclobacillus dauci]|uniref:Uncharacterized protein n=1 Tax=Alicyclobacillus dauci TaxID=1475485 RepID=A0ABY6YZP9_9BACL|nr:hypothetical protein [Alicyclobacillus dauci]WAH36062.1 hypothetical protein NZD86_17660 [Alicyclobacillus dauci]